MLTLLDLLIYFMKIMQIQYINIERNIYTNKELPLC